MKKLIVFIALLVIAAIAITSVGALRSSPDVPEDTQGTTEAPSSSEGDSTVSPPSTEGSSNNQGGSTTDSGSNSGGSSDSTDLLTPVSYDPGFFTAEAVQTSTSQDWQFEDNIKPLSGYDLPRTTRNYFDFNENSSGKYQTVFEVESEQYYCVTVKSYDSSPRSVNFNVESYNIKATYTDVVYVEGENFGKNCAYEVYFIYTAGIRDLYCVFDTKNVEVYLYLTPFRLFGKGLIGTYVKGYQGGGKFVIPDASVGRYYSNNFCGDELIITVNGSEDSASEVTSLGTSNINGVSIDMFYFDTYHSGDIEITGIGASSVFNVFGAINRELPLPPQFEGTLVEDWTLSSFGQHAGQILSCYLSTDSDYCLILNEIYSERDVFVEINGKVISIVPYDYYQYISLANYTSSDRAFVRIYLEGHVSLVEGKFALYKLENYA